MTAFLIKSTLSMLVFFLFYKLVLEREKMHKINRFLLLFALVFSVVIPFVDIEFITENKIINTIPSYVLPTIFIGTPEVETQTNSFTSEHILWAVYGLGFLVFLFRFVRNLFSIMSRIHESEKIKKDGFILVLVKDEILPHSFLNYVFISKKQYETNQIDNELFVHEKAHITQKHSLDILFIEVLQVVFWFNPIIYLYKKAIKLNHEFLADQTVNQTFGEVVHYQKLLLQKAVGNSLVPIASNLNYSVTKKRFIMMTKNTSIFSMISKTGLSVLLFTFLLLSCSKEDKNFDKPLSREEINEILKTIKDVNPKDFTDEQWNALYQDYLYKYENEEFTAIPFEDVKAYTEYMEKNYYLPVKTGQYDENNVYTAVEVMPEYPGGEEAFRKFVAKNFKAPKVDKDLKGVIYVQFVVEPDGSLSDINVVRDLGYGTGEETVRILKLAEKWKPGVQNGEAVRVKYTLPIQVNISNK